MQNSIEIANAAASDAPLILSFIKELAVYEKALHEVTATVADIEKTLLSADPDAHALICRVNNEPAGFAVYFFNYSTWLGQAGLYLEDLYVSPRFRRFGAGKALLKHLAGIAVEKKCQRFEFSVLDWNQPAMDFYESTGALPQKEWIRYRLSGKALAQFAADSRDF